VDPAGDDDRLKAGSPASKAGFEPIDASRFGRRGRDDPGRDGRGMCDADGSFGDRAATKRPAARPGVIGASSFAKAGSSSRGGSETKTHERFVKTRAAR